MLFASTPGGSQNSLMKLIKGILQCRCLPPSLLRDTLSSRIVGRDRLALELDGARNTRIKTDSGHEMRNTLRPVWLLVLPQVLMCLEGGSLPALIYSGGTGLHGKSQPSTVGVLLQPGRVVSLYCSQFYVYSGSYKRGRYIHVLSLTLEHSMPISSLVAPGLTKC